MNVHKITVFVVIVLSALGGLFGFETILVGSDKYCYLITEDQPSKGNCTSTMIDTGCRVLNPGENKMYYTLTDNVLFCSSADCPNIGKCDLQ